MQSTVAGASMGPEFQEMSVGGGGVPSSIIGGVGERVPADKREKKKKKSDNYTEEPHPPRSNEVTCCAGEKFAFSTHGIKRKKQINKNKKD